MSSFVIVVPYRDRLDHLQQFVPALCIHLKQQLQAGSGPDDFEIIICEQDDEHLFNRGALANAGFTIASPAIDAVCIHDVDFLPVDVVYHVPPAPMRLIWQGVETRPLVPNGPHLIKHHFDRFFGAVIVLSADHFRRINGFSNGYPGWGFEDSDLRQRCLLHRLNPVFGHGHFRALDHENRGLNSDLSFKPVARQNQQRFARLWSQSMSDGNHQNDGLNTIKFSWTERSPVVDFDTGGAALRLRHVLIKQQQ